MNLDKPSFYDAFGRGITAPVNAVAYNLTDGGDLVRGKPYLWPALESHVHHCLNLYRETFHIGPAQVKRELTVWLERNENHV